MSEHEIPIRSFGVVFDLERRIHKIDRFRVPLPYGLPLRSLGYAIVALAIVLAASAMPVLGRPIVGIPAPLRLVGIPVATAYALTGLQIDGRPPHVAAATVARYVLGPRRIAAWLPANMRATRLDDIPFVADEHTSQLRPGRLRGPVQAVARGERIRLTWGERVMLR